MVNVTSTLASVLRQGMALFLQPGRHKLEDSHKVVGWSKTQPGNIVIEDVQGKRTVIWHEDQVYIPTNILL